MREIVIVMAAWALLLACLSTYCSAFSPTLTGGSPFMRRQPPYQPQPHHQTRMVTPIGSDEPLVFAGVKFPAPISSSLRSMGITTPSPIQQASLVAITTGLSCILHAETGSGKTLTYLLPILKRVYSSGGSAARPLQAMIVVPTKELAVQVAADAASLVSASGSGVTEEDTRIVHLCLSSSKSGLDGITAPIIVGTPFKLVEAVLASSPSALAGLSYLVLDEVDRLINALGKYSTSDDRRASRDYDKPVEELLTILVKLKGILGASGSAETGAMGMQVVAASATVGRALRRELFRLLQGGQQGSGSKANAGVQGELPVLRPVSVPLPITAGGKSLGVADSMKTNRKNAEVANTQKNLDGMDDGDEESGSSATPQFTRKVGIPTTITHRCVLVQEASNEINTKLASAKKLWTTTGRSAQRGLLFVPRAEDVTQVLGMLTFWGLEATNLQKTLGIEALRPVGRFVGKRRYKLPGEAKVDESEAEAEAKASSPKLSSGEMVLLAARNKIGSSARSESGDSSSSKRELFVVPVSGTRGLHIQDVEWVYILQPPKTMDEYLHMAGRTGRQGNTVPGTVVSLVNYDELLRLQSWQTALGITFDVEYEQ